MNWWDRSESLSPTPRCANGSPRWRWSRSQGPRRKVSPAISRPKPTAGQRSSEARVSNRNSPPITVARSPSPGWVAESAAHAKRRAVQVFRFSNNLGPSLPMTAGCCCRVQAGRRPNAAIACRHRRRADQSSSRRSVVSWRDRDHRSARRLLFLGGNQFHQRHQLTLHRLILDLAVGPQQPQAERAVKKQETLDLARLVVAVVEERDGDVERGGDLLKAGSAHAVHALLVFLNLLEADAKLVAKLRLRDLLFDASQPDSLAKLNVGLAGTALLHLLSC